MNARQFAGLPSPMAVGRKKGTFHGTLFAGSAILDRTPLSIIRRRLPARVKFRKSLQILAKRRKPVDE